MWGAKSIYGGISNMQYLPTEVFGYWEPSAILRTLLSLPWLKSPPHPLVVSNKASRPAPFRNSLPKWRKRLDEEKFWTNFPKMYCVNCVFYFCPCDMYNCLYLFWSVVYYSCCSSPILHGSRQTGSPEVWVI